jgi:DNA repair protein RadC
MTKRKLDPNDRNAVCELAAKYFLEDIQKEGPLEDSKRTETFLLSYFHNKKQEEFAVIFLDTRHRVIICETLFHGTVDGATVYPRVIAQKALEHNAGAIIIAHNHPSGVAEPSLADQAITRRIKDALLLLDIRLLDHFIVGIGTTTSMATRGLL